MIQLPANDISYAYFPDRPGDRQLFRQLWSAYLIELQELGGEQIPSARTIAFYASLYDRYMEDPMQGAIYFVGEPWPVGVIMWGDPGPLPWDHTLGRLAQGWGTYVSPQNRGEGLSRVLRDTAVAHLRTAGFNCVLGSGNPSNTTGISSGGSYGFEPLHDTRVLRI